VNLSGRSTLAMALNAALRGDPGAIAELSAAGNSQIVAAADELPGPLVLTGEAVATVLQGLVERKLDPADCQAWASFVRRGYVSNAAGGATDSLDIDYELTRDEQIADAVSRLDELGDVIDGEISDDEAFELIHSLR